MADTSIITARVADEMVVGLDRLAREYDRPRGWHIARAIERYLADETPLLDMILEGEGDIAAGRTHTQDEVEAMFGVNRSERDAA